MCETAAKWTDSQARLQFRFFLNLFNCLLTTNLSRRNNRSRTGPQTLFNFRRNSNRQWIFIKFHVYSRYLAATRDVHSTTTGCKWLIFHFTTMMQRNQSAHTAWGNTKRQKSYSNFKKCLFIAVTLKISCFPPFCVIGSLSKYIYSIFQEHNTTSPKYAQTWSFRFG